MTKTIKFNIGCGHINLKHPFDVLKVGAVTAPRVQQILDSDVFNEMAVPVRGNYSYKIKGDCYFGYYIATTCGFTETDTHKRPKDAFIQFISKTPSWAEKLN